MQVTEDKITEIFYLADGFCQNFKKEFDGHLIVNERGEILNFVITQANVDDRQRSRKENSLRTR